MSSAESDVDENKLSKLFDNISTLYYKSKKMSVVVKAELIRLKNGGQRDRLTNQQKMLSKLTHCGKCVRKNQLHGEIGLRTLSL